VPAGTVETDARPEPRSLTIALALPIVGAGVMAGGVFDGAWGRVAAVCAGLLGLGLALVVERVRRPLLLNLAVVGGIFAIGLVTVLPGGPANLGSLQVLVAEAVASGDVLRPPVPFTVGWQAIVGWLMGLIGFTTGWVAISYRRPPLAAMVPLPFAAIAGISVPSAAQVPSGIAVLVLFAAGLGTLSAVQARAESHDAPSLGFEIQRALRAIPVLALIAVGAVGLSRADFLFPDPFIDPASEAQKPRPVPLEDVEDRVLFTVDSLITGPWRQGGLDVYDGKDWRLAPFAEGELSAVPSSGVVDEDLRSRQGSKATFTVAGLSGAVLPTLPNTVGIIAQGPRLSYDARNANIRVSQGQLTAGLTYTVTAAALPTVEELRQVTSELPEEVLEFAVIPVEPPPAAAALIDRAPKSSKWDEFDFLRTHLLDNVTAAGLGVPRSVTAARVQDMLAGSQEASPYEIVAAQAMFARWIGIPARIGYGFDGGDLLDGQFQVRPRHGASFVEVYFPGFKWLPVIGTPKKAKPTVGGDPSQQQVDPSVLPSDEIGVELLLPAVVDPPGILGDQLRRAALISVATFLLLFSGYLIWPAVRKAWLRSRLRDAAGRAGPRARLALAYAEWRDHACDFGFDHPTDTPLMFLRRFPEDEEHTALAWLVTRALWGDLGLEVTEEMATAAEELSRALRHRLSTAQPVTLRAIALISRLSLDTPFAPETDLRKGGEMRETRQRQLVSAAQR